MRERQRDDCGQHRPVEDQQDPRGTTQFAQFSRHQYGTFRLLNR